MSTVFLEALANALAFRLRQVVDKQLAVEMIHLVLDTHGEQPVEFAFDFLAITIEVANADLLGAGT